MIRKLSLVVLMLAILSQGLMAAFVGKNEATAAAKNFYYEYANQLKKVSYGDIQVSSYQTWQADGKVVFHIFNMKPEGFVIVAAEDNVTPVLGYSFEGVFTGSNMPPQMTAWFDGYAQQVVYHRVHHTNPDSKISADWKHLTAAQEQELQSPKSKFIQPLLITTWDQGSFYNELCPQAAGGPGGRVWAGCVATAMAQVMYYYRYPSRGNGSHGYNSSYGYLSANYGNTTYEWDKMLNALGASNISVATLLYHCGVAVDMMYSPTGSGAYSWDAAEALKNYFGYSSNTRLEDKDNYTDPQWSALLRQNLDNKKPMYYHGYGSGGHAFNVDGYQTDDYFHFNWGWSGSYNGYFYLNNLNPGGNTFTNGQGAIVDIYPAGNYPDYCAGMKQLTALNGTFEDGSGPNNYQANADCKFYIDPQSTTGDSVEKIQIIFNRFTTESGNDVVSLYAGNSTSAPLIGTYSGDALPQTMTVNSNKVLVHFTSNSLVSNEGFFITYKSKVPEYCQGVDEHTALSGTIEDGSGSKNYTNSTVCQWFIHPANCNNVSLNFNSIDILAGDFIEVYAYDTISGNGNLLGRFDGNTIPPQQVSQTGAMYLIFYSNTAGTAQGFSATYFGQQVGIGEENNISGFSILPNPTTDYLLLTISAKEHGNAEVQLLDITGKSVLSKQLELGAGQNSARIDLSTIEKGVYFLRISNEEGSTTRKVIKQ
jgi:hypothetical protein